MRRIEKQFLALFVVTAGSVLTITGLISVAQAQLPEPSFVISQSSNPLTYLTEIDSDTIVIQITEGEFIFHGWLSRTSGNTFTGEDDQVRVIYDRDTKRVVVMNKQTGTEFYNYFFSDVDEGAL